MHRVGNLWEEVCSIENLRKAHINASHDKSKYREVIMVQNNLNHYLYLIREMLINKTFTTSDYQVFYKREKYKVRKLYKLPYFPDRIVQWALLQVIMPIIDKQFTIDTYSAIKGRGPAIIAEDINSIMATDPESFHYALKIDIKHYYQSINHEELKKDYRRLIKDPDALWLIDDFIDSVSTADEEDLKRLNTDEPTGIPIGNYFSQPSGNLYLSKFDHWIKEQHKVSIYYRYMDDIVIGSDSKEFLHNLLPEIKEYLWINRKLKMKSNWQIINVYKEGLDFIGYRFFPEYTKLRKSIANNIKKQADEISEKDFITYHNFCSINSFYGFLKLCNSYRFGSKYLNPINHKLSVYLERERKQHEAIQ